MAWGPFFPSLSFPIPIALPLPFPLGYSGGISVPTHSPGALVLPLRPSCLSHPSPGPTPTPPPPKAWACQPALFQGSPPFPHSFPPNRHSSRAEWQGVAESVAADQSTVLLLLVALRGLHRYGTVRAHRQSLPCHLLTEQASTRAHSVIQPVHPSSGSSGRPTSQPVNQAAIDRFINQFTHRSLGLSTSQPLIQTTH